MLQGLLLPWFRAVRRDLPWRRTRDPYAIWLSEIMLQQTQVATVVPYYERFVRELPTVMALAEAPPDRVMGLWSGLGYYRRARMLHDAAKEIVHDRGGAFPGTAAGLREVRGIGPYTAGAIASIAFGERAPLVDGNVARVLARLFALEDDLRSGAGLARVWSLAEALVPEERPGDWNEALMELGATTCTPRAPRCPSCPVREVCEGLAKGMAETLPRMKPRKPPVASHVDALVATVRGRVVLLRRKRAGLFGGLWQPPILPRPTATPADDDARIGFGALLDVPPPKIAHAGDVRHVLSHRVMNVRVLLTRLPRLPAAPRGPDAEHDAVEAFPPEALPGLGMSALGRKVVAAAGSAAMQRKR